MLGEAFQVEGGEIEDGGHHGGSQGEAYAGGAQLKVDAADDDHDEHARDGRAGQEADDPVHRLDLVTHHAAVAEACLFQHLPNVLGFPFAVAQPQGLVGGEGEHLARVAYARHGDARVDHRLGDARVAVPPQEGVAVADDRVFAVGLGRSTHHRPHIRLILVGHGFARLVDHRGGADGGARTHVDAVAGDGDERSRRGGVVVDEDHHGDGTVEDRRAYAVGAVEQPPVGVHVDQDVVGMDGAGVGQSFFRQTPRRPGDLLTDGEEIDHLVPDGRVGREGVRPQGVTGRERKDGCRYQKKEKDHRISHRLAV